MNDDRDASKPTDEAGPEEPLELAALPLEIDPPPSLEGRVRDALVGRGLIRRDGTEGAPFRSWLTAAAAMVLVAVGFVAGRASVRSGVDAATPEPPTSYALVLYESEGFERATGEEAALRFDAYSRWVAEAREREQFVTGEDLSVQEGVTLVSAGAEVTQAAGVAAPDGAALSGMFVVTGRTIEDVLEIARSLPHLRYGGDVVVQRIIPTDVRPSTSPGGS